MVPGRGLSCEFLGELTSELRRNDVAHVTGTFSITAAASMLASVRAGVPFVVSPRGSLEPWALRVKTWKKLPVLQALKILMNRAEAIHATSDQEADGLARLGLRVPIAVVPNAVAEHVDGGCAAARWRERLDLAPGTAMLLLLGRIHPVKGIDVALESMIELTSTDIEPVLVVAGPDGGPYERKIEALVRAHGLQSRVRRVPLVTGAEKQQLLAEADLLLLPSRQENFGNVVVEALAAGTPVIASQATPWKLLEQEGCGAWVPLDAGAFARSVRKMLCDRSLLARMGARAQVVARERFSLDAVVPAMVRLYETISTRGMHSTAESLP
jgi:glycosyltransferase involved in cell wall biosynthesis